MKHLKTIFILYLFFVSSGIHAQLDLVKLTITDGLTNTTLREKIEKNGSAFISAMNRTIVDGKKKPKVENTYCTKDGEKSLLEMWKTSAMISPVSQVSEKCITLPGGGYQIRNIAVTMFDAPETEQEQEIVLNFTSDGKVDNILVATENNRYVDVLSSNISVDDLARRQIIIDFVENFRTAYNRKDLKYLESVFDNNALIITGKVIKIKPNDDLVFRQLGSEKIIYQTQRKDEYIAGLKKCFAVNKYIDVAFDSLQVVRHPARNDVYGVTLKQDWKSSRYNDTGYVFLMIDFKDETQPCIQVRTWQPEKYNGKPLNRNELFTVTSFNL